MRVGATPRRIREQWPWPGATLIGRASFRACYQSWREVIGPGVRELRAPGFGV